MTDDRGVVPQSVDHAPHRPLAFIVERAGRLVEHQQRRIAQQRARQDDALALAARKAGAALADRAVEPAGRLVDHAIGAGQRQHAAQIGLAASGVAHCKLARIDWLNRKFSCGT